MEDIFVKLFDEINDAKSFEDSLETHFQAIQDFLNAPYQIQKAHKDEIDRLILLKYKAMSGSSFHTVEKRSFILILLDFCERFTLYGSIPRIVRIIKKNDISVNKRMSAALKYLYPSPSSNEELVERFDDVCSLLDEAIAEEEDDISKPLITFLNYYAHVIYNTNAFYASLMHDRLVNALSSGNYDWLKEIEDVALFDVTNSDCAYANIEERIDEIGCKRETISSESSAIQEILIEEDTDYCKELAMVPNRFLAVRQISVRHADGYLNGRGVLMLDTESEMFEYIKRFGKMHYAKLLSSFESPFPQSFNEPVNIIDWGCGQALASMTFIEKYGASSVNSITLIEPSEIVLKRAALHCKKFAPNTTIYTICKKLDDVSKGDITLCVNESTVNIFSNILDIDDYRINHLLAVADGLLCRKNYFICVSPYIDDIKSSRLSIFMRHFSHNPTFQLYHDIENTKNGNFWMCNNKFQNDRASHGSSLSCLDYNANGCFNKWTRVLKVFSV